MRLGIRLQWLLAFGALLVLTFLPLYFAVARLAQTAVANASEGAARTLAVSVAERIERRYDDALPGNVAQQILGEEVDGDRVVAIAVYGADGTRVGVAGVEPVDLPDHQLALDELIVVKKRPASGTVLALTRRPVGRFTVGVVVSADLLGQSANPFVKLVALYMGLVAVALLFVGYLTMTRLVVRPIERLSHGAGKVAEGGRTFELPETGAREIADLASSLRAMTERLRADEESLRAKVAELEKTTRDLEGAQETLIRSERLASVGRLAAGLAHEIGNPIAAILGFEELLLEGGLGPEEQRDFLVRMKRETERIHRVLRDLLDFARAPQVGSAASESYSRGSVATAVEVTLTLVEPQKELRHLKLSSDVPEGLPSIAMTEERLEQVLLNLLLNAADATPDDGASVTIAARASGNAVEVAVTDNGPGIADEVMATIFDPFVTTKAVGKGTGLGLAVCRSLVEAAGGTISARNAPGGGASFVVKLPVAKS